MALSDVVGWENGWEFLARDHYLFPSADDGAESAAQKALVPSQ
jgi:hypothetical protein